MSVLCGCRDVWIPVAAVKRKQGHVNHQNPPATYFDTVAFESFTDTQKHA